jgi:hypothetical protein
VIPDDLRGHDWFPAEDYLGGVPRLYATESVRTADKLIHLHYFCGPCDWYIAEIGEDRRIAFGYANLGDPSSRGVGLHRPQRAARPVYPAACCA